MIRTLLLALAFLFAVPAAAQNFPQLTGRVVDQANLLDPAQEAALTAKLEALQERSSRQLVVVTIPSLDGYDIADYGYQLGRHWGIGQRGANNGVLLIVAVAEHKIRIEVGYGLEGIMTDALSSQIIANEMQPRFRANDYPGGINAGADAIIAQLQAPPEAAEARAQAAAAAAARNRDSGDGEGMVTLIIWVIVLGFFVFSSIASRFGRGRRYRRGRRGPVIIWGPGLGGGNGSSWSGGSSWGSGGGSSWGGGGGGFSGGGGSFGGGGASGGW